jgi:hypothetical protein
MSPLSTDTERGIVVSYETIRCWTKKFGRDDTHRLQEGSNQAINVPAQHGPMHDKSSFRAQSAEHSDAFLLPCTKGLFIPQEKQQGEHFVSIDFSVSPEQQSLQGGACRSAVRPCLRFS